MCINVHKCGGVHVCESSAYRGQKSETDPLELEL